MTTTISAGPLPRPPTPTIDVLPSPTAQLYSYVHPTLLLSLYAIRFPTLVADPISTLLSDLPVVAALQIAYVVTCLPQAGSVPIPLYQQENLTESGSVQGTPGKRNPSSGSSVSAASSSPSHLLRAGKSPLRRKRSNIHSYSPSKGHSNGVTNKLSASLLSLTLTFCLGTPILSILLILFGAPVTTHITHTVLCAAHMSVLSAFSLIYVHGVDSTAWREVWGASRPTDTVWGASLGTGIGAWLGAIPIPLDWDRPWQAWPVTIVTGAYLGYVAGSLIGRTSLVYGRVVEFDFSTEDERQKEVIEKEKS